MLLPRQEDPPPFIVISSQLLRLRIRIKSTKDGVFFQIERKISISYNIETEDFSIQIINLLFCSLLPSQMKKLWDEETKQI